MKQATSTLLRHFLCAAAALAAAAFRAAAATSDIPIVFAAVTDPIGAGLVGADGKPD
ncbi:MAG: BMP family ABC transporter substrate-binding protein, partial [Kiritimatiellae bacterium]|nr:BMP family ABC transporter substrate-binding protein [Kiritimatiellia bacterium]